MSSAGVDPEDVSLAMRADVLLVEDNDADVRLVREAFDRFDRQVRVVGDGDSAIDLFGRLADRVDGNVARNGPGVVLLDLDLPGASGLEVLGTVRDHAGLRHLPVVVLSNSMADRDVARAYGQGANAYISKPTGLDGFADVIEAIDRFWLRSVRLP